MKKFPIAILILLFLSACATSIPSPVEQEFRDQYRLASIDVIYTHKSDIDDAHSANIRNFIDQPDNALLSGKFNAFANEEADDDFLGRGDADKFFAFLVVEDLKEGTESNWSGGQAANLNVYIDGIAIPNLVSGAIFGDFRSAISRFELIDDSSGERIVWRDKKNMLMIGNDDSTPAGSITMKYSKSPDKTVSNFATIASMVSNEIISALNASTESPDMGDVRVNSSVLAGSRSETSNK